MPASSLCRTIRSGFLLLSVFALNPLVLGQPEGPVRIIGEVGSKDATVSPELFVNPTVALIDVSHLITGDPASFVEERGQILGVLTAPLFPMPSRFEISLPIVPLGKSVDIDRDETAETGVQIFAVSVAANLIGSSYLQQLEQIGGLMSMIPNQATGAIMEGTFLVYSADGKQGFPTAAGSDGVWFTDDDAHADLPAGYSVVTLQADGTSQTDRSPQPTINTIEREESASPDFSTQGILESFHSMIDTLKERYAYTKLRNLDWEEIRQELLPRVEAADAAGDITAYYLVIDELAVSIQDSHVSVTIPYANLEAHKAKILKFNEKHAAGLGARLIALTDPTKPDAGPGDKFVVLTVEKDSPAAKEGWSTGTEVVSINGQTPAERLETMSLFMGMGTEEARKLFKTTQLLRFPEGETVEIGYRLPGSQELRTAEMKVGDVGDGYNPPLGPQKAPISYERRGPFAVVRWSDFMGYALAKVAVLEEALAQEGDRSSGGIVLDLRGNLGGWVELYQTMASYFFTEEAPMKANAFDWFEYDQEASRLVKAISPDYELHAHDPDLAYRGPVVVLVDNQSASAAEYFSQHLQVLGRAKVVGQFVSQGAGGPIDIMKLPGDMTLRFTKGRTYFAGSEVLNLEGKGVVPDVRVPVTLETEQAKLRGEDPVMDAALDVLAEMAAEQSKNQTD